MKRILSLIIVMIMISTAAIVPVGATADDKGAFKKKSVTAHIFKKDKTATLNCLFFDDMPNIPYVNAEEYLNQIYTIEFSTVDNRDGTYTVKNDNGEMAVDTVKDTVHFDCYEDLVYYDSVDANEEEDADYIDWDTDALDYQGKINSVDLDLGKYDLDLVGDSGKAYFPLSTISDIFSDTYLSAIYLDGEIYFIRSQDEEAYYDDSSVFRSLSRSKDITKYAYNELCFMIDYFYGRPSKAEISDEIKEKGLDAALDSYDSSTARAKELLRSDSLIDFCKGLMLLDNYFADGGHTMLGAGAILEINNNTDSDFSTELIKSLYSPDNPTDAMFAAPLLKLSNESSDQSTLSSAKDDAFEDLKSVKKWDDAEFFEHDKTGYFVFDEFKSAVVEPFKWSLDYADEHKYENFVVDLTTNSGGSQAVVFYMLSVMCGESAIYQYNTLTGNLYKEDPVIDRNLDGKFDDKDKDVKYDLNFAILTSHHSFSSGNMLPCLAKKQGVAIIGETSGGGTCALAMRYLPDGMSCYMSSDMVITYPDGTDVDAGAEPDTELDVSDSYERFYDFDKIDDGIDHFYNHKGAEPTEASTEKATEDTTEKPTEPSEPSEPTEASSNSSLSGRSIASDLTILYIIIGAMAVILIIIIILIVVLIKSSKKKK